jgi:trimeric autotransporter adhesin
MSSTKNKLRLAGAFAALAALALAVSCTGFFQNPTVSSITIDPPNPSVDFGGGSDTTQQMVAAATYSDGSTGTLTGGTSCTGSTVCWSSSDTTVATITTGGLLTGVSQGTSTITAASGAITATTTATVLLGNITNFQVCEGSFGDTTSCSSGSTPVTWSPDVGSELQTQTFVAQGSSNGQEFDLTTSATWTVVGSPSTVSCDNSSSPALCTVDQGATGTYTVTVTYGTNLTATINIVATN